MDYEKLSDTGDNTGTSVYNTGNCREIHRRREICMFLKFQYILGDAYG